MPYCPNCKTEYYEGCRICNGCGYELVSILEPEQELTYEQEEFLVNAADEMEANIIESLLNSCGIPVVKVHREVGNYIDIYMVKSITGIDIFVAKDKLQIAKEILNSKTEILDETTELSIDNIQNSRPMVQRIIVWFVIIAFLSLFLFSTWAFLVDLLSR